MYESEQTRVSVLIIQNVDDCRGGGGTVKVGDFVFNSSVFLRHSRSFISAALVHNLCGAGLQPVEGTQLSGHISVGNKQKKSLAVRQSSNGAAECGENSMRWLAAAPRSRLATS